MTATLVRSATITDDGRYRYELVRVWDPAPSRTVVWVMLNPSTADGLIDDPTIRRCLRFSRERGFGQLAVVNLLALRATDPAELSRADDPVGPENLDYVRSWCGRADLVVAAWGAWAGLKVWGPAWIARLLEGVPLVCLGMTKDGAPRHPLYVRSDQPFEPWSA